MVCEAGEMGIRGGGMHGAAIVSVAVWQRHLSTEWA